MKRKEFTILELLIVIAVIGILITLLIPSLSKAKEAGMSAVCKSNLSQCGTAIYSYTKDWNQFIPAYDGVGKDNGGADASDWKVMLFPYLGLSKDSDKKDPVFACPMAVEIKGMNKKYTDGLAYTKESGRFKKSTQVQLLTVESPSESLFMSDTIDWPNHSKQVKALMYPSNSGDIIPIGDRHKKGVNILWADNSIGWMSQNQMRTGKDGYIDYYYLFKKD